MHKYSNTQINYWPWHNYYWLMGQNTNYTKYTITQTHKNPNGHDTTVIAYGPKYKYNIHKIHKHTNTQIHKFTNTQLAMTKRVLATGPKYKYKIHKIYKHTKTQRHKYANTQIHNWPWKLLLANIQIRKHTNTQLAMIQLWLATGPKYKYKYTKCINTKIHKYTTGRDTTVIG